MISQEITDVLMAPVAILLEPKNAQSIYYQFTALVIAIGAYFYTRKKTDKLQSVGLIGWLLPKDILTHPSAMTDYGYFIVSQMLAASIYGSIIISSAAWEQGAAGLLTSVFGPAGVGVGSSHWITLICTLLLLIVIDAAVWWAHYMFHVVPFLWEFHKVHHSAEVMTPITALRMHPVEQLADALVVGLVTGVVIAIIRYSFGSGAMFFSVFEINLFTAGFFVIGHNLRHSHVWIRYPYWLQHILICPAQHQIHHSRSPRHWDKNMGIVFSFWDWAAGTLYAPKHYEQLEYGLGTQEDGTWRGVGTLMFRPFRQSFQVLARQWAERAKRPGKPERAAPPDAERQPLVRTEGE